MASRGVWLAENQQIFRHANERLQGLTEDRVESGTQVPFLCEYADRDCLGRIVLSTGDYEAVHIDRDQYVILPGHATSTTRKSWSGMTVSSSFGRAEGAAPGVPVRLAVA